MFTDKVIERKDFEEIRRWLDMTKIGKMIADEIEEAKIEAKKEIAVDYARTLIEQGMDTDQIVIKVKVLTEEQIDALR